MEENITVIKTTMAVLTTDQVAWQVNFIKWISETMGLNSDKTSKVFVQ